MDEKKVVAIEETMDLPTEVEVVETVEAEPIYSDDLMGYSDEDSSGKGEMAKEVATHAITAVLGFVAGAYHEKKKAKKAARAAANPDAVPKETKKGFHPVLWLKGKIHDLTAPKEEPVIKADAVDSDD